MWKVFLLLFAVLGIVISALIPPLCPVGQRPSCSNNCNAKCVNFLTGVVNICPKYLCTRNNTKCECDPKQDQYYDEVKDQCVPSCACRLEPTPKHGKCPKGQELTCDTLCNRRCENFISNCFSMTCPEVDCDALRCLCDPGQDYWYSDKDGCVPSKDCK